MIQIAYHSDLKEVHSRKALEALLEHSEARAPFDRLWWWQGLAEHCGLDPVLAVASQGGEHALLPLAGKGGHLMGLGNWYSFRIRPLLDGSPALLEALAGDLARYAHRVTLSPMPDEDGSASLVEDAFRKAGWLVRREACDVNHVLDLRGRDYAAYIAARPGRLRTTLKRKTPKVTTQVHDRFDHDAWDDYEAIYGESWKPAEGSPAFLRAFAEAEGRAGRLRLGIARSAFDSHGPAIAAQFWTVEGGTAWIHKLAHRESAADLSPGSVLTAAMMRQVIDADGVDLVDFGTGNDPYKRDWMEAVRPRYRLDMMRPFSARNWPVMGRGALQRLAAIAKRG